MKFMLSGIKRWVTAGIIGIGMAGLGLSGVSLKLGIQIEDSKILWGLILGGFILIFAAAREMVFSFTDLRKNRGSIRDKTNPGRGSISRRMLYKGPRIVVVGGGTGLSVLLRGLKQFTANLTAVVTVADDGGGSGILRSELGMLPPGDIRNCILALADTEPVMEQLLQYRFEEGSLKGQSFGNLLIAAMNSISHNFEEAVKRISQVLAVTGQVLPLTLEDVTLYAQLRNGKVVKGESNIPREARAEASPIDRIFIRPEHPEPLPEVLDAIRSADAVVFGPGSLYTSIIPNLLAGDVVRTVSESDAVKIYVANIMTQPGETDGFSVSDHIRVLEEHGGKKFVDFVIANSGEIGETYLDKYYEDGSAPVGIDSDRIRPGIKVISQDLVYMDGEYIRHNAMELAKLIIKLAIRNEPGIMDYYYLLTKIYDRRKVI